MINVEESVGSFKGFLVCNVLRVISARKVVKFLIPNIMSKVGWVVTKVDETIENKLSEYEF